MTTRLPISVLVPTKNSAATVEACIESILTVLPNDGSEVVVVDGSSTDGTPVRMRVLPVRLETIAPCFVAHSRNVAVRSARHSIVAFIDSDCTVDTGWYEAIQTTLSDDAIGIVGSRYAIRPRPTWVERAWDRAHRRAPEPVLADVAYVPGGNLAMRREVFDLIGGFDERIETGEDMDLCTRVRQSGYRVVDHSGMTCVHLGEPKTLAAVYRRNRWHGRGTRLRYADGRLAPILLSTIAFAGSVALAMGSAAVTASRGVSAITALIGLPLAVPVVYAARYARRPRTAHAIQLVAIYLAYFSGRARALPAVLGRVSRERAAGKQCEQCTR